ncbi:MAG: 2-oxo acid dehydrogenase subunit E2 [bacterium]|nr:2-oxo acid dehydrogenase subunit E2 [bacterium]
MAEKLLMVALSPTMEVGTIAKWHVEEGAQIRPGTVVCDVETDKATMEYESPTEGTLLKILVPAGGKAAVGEVIGIVGTAGEDISSIIAELSKSPTQPEKSDAVLEAKRDEVAAAVPGIEAAENVISTRVIRSSPLARKLASEYGIDLRDVPGSGPGGRIVKSDVEAVRRAREKTMREAHTPETKADEGDTFLRVTQMRRIIAERLSASMYSAPHYYLKVRVEMDPVLRAREVHSRTAERPCSLNAILMYFVAQALRKHPMVNASWEGDQIRLFRHVHLGLAVAVSDGLLTPVVRNCEKKSIREIEEELRPLIERARAGKLAPEEFTGATFTITNLGSYGIEEFTAIINPPGAAILAVGEARKEQIVDKSGDLRVATMMRLTLSCDHRVIDGAVGAAFLRDVKDMIEQPVLLLF